MDAINPTFELIEQAQIIDTHYNMNDQDQRWTQDIFQL